ncbi:hypothetical protein RYD26_06385 [Pasteurellaceae bacterium LIM206]|nr:hypothetical protein [Pasteurellaceae bacterium LIM206]
MNILSKLFTWTSILFLIACGSSNSGYEKIRAVVTASNGNLYVLTDSLDYEFPKVKAKDVQLFFELAPAFTEIGQPISARMWVKERSVYFSFTDVILSVQQTNDYKSVKEKASKVKEIYTKNGKAKQLLSILEKMVKQDRTGKLAIKRENSEGSSIDYIFRNKRKTKNNGIQGKVVEISNRKDIINEYQSDNNNFKEYRINVFYEPSIIEKGMFGKKIAKEILVSGDEFTLSNWKTISPLQIEFQQREP